MHTVTSKRAKYQPILATSLRQISTLVVLFFLGVSTVLAQGRYQKVHEGFDTYSSAMVTTQSGNLVHAGDKLVKTNQAGDVAWALAFSREVVDVTQTTDGVLWALLEQSRVVRVDTSGMVLNTFDFGTYTASAIVPMGTDVVIVARHYTSLPTYNALMVRMTSTGSIVWSRAFGGIYAGALAFAFDAIATSDNGILVTGQGDVGSHDDFSNGVLVMKVDGNGNFLWGKKFGAIQTTTDINVPLGYGLAELSDGSYAVVGCYQCGVYNQEDALLLRVAQNGTYISHRTYGGGLADRFNAVAVTPSNNLILTGTSRSFDPNTISPQGQVYGMKVNFTGDTLWTKVYGGNLQNDIGYAVQAFGENFVMSGTRGEGTYFYQLGGDTDGNTIACPDYATTTQVGNRPLLEEDSVALWTTTNLSLTASTVTETPTNTVVEVRSLTIEPNATVTDDCNTNLVGGINLNPLGGMSYGFFQYTWSNGATSEDLTNLGAGSYTITLRPYNSLCEWSETYTVNDNPPPYSVTVNSVTPSCAGQSTGSIDATVNGGGTYTYSYWAHNSNSGPDLNNAAPGTYYLVVDDFLNTCRDTTAITIGSTPAISISSVSSTDPTACDSNDGTLSITASGGSGVLAYSANGSSFSPSSTIGNLAGGTYTPTVRDTLGCTATDATVTLTAPTGGPLSWDSFTDSVCASETQVTYSVIPSAGSTYFWSLPTGAAVATDNNHEVIIDFTAFAGGNISVVGIDSTGCVSDTLSAYVGVKQSPYALGTISVSCEQTDFTIPINGGPSTTDVLGIDFCLEYDTAVMTPTGTASLGDVVTGGNPSYADYYLNIDNPGVVYGIIYYTPSAPFPTYLSGNGLVIELDYTLKPGIPSGTVAEISLCGMSEGTLSNGNVSSCTGVSSSVTVVSDPTFTGNLTYWDRVGRPITYNPADTTLATMLTGQDSLCNPTGYSILPDSIGYFAFNTDFGSHMSITRDIPGDYGSASNCTNVMDFVNGTDQTRAMRIATLDATLVPSVYQILAADVNLDGVVSSVDVTLIANRAVMAICGYPNTSSGPSLDWVFMEKTAADTAPAYQISSIFPGDDGLGYSRSRLPVLPDCFELPITYGPVCTEVGSGTYQGVLLGDVNGNWTTADGNQAREQNEGPVITLDLLAATTTDNFTIVPLRFEANESIEALDLNLSHSDAFSISQVHQPETFDDWFVTWNMPNSQQFLLTSFTLEPTATSGEIFRLQFEGQLTEEQALLLLDNSKAYLNGEPVTLEVSREDEVTGFGEDEFAAELLVFPNPATEVATIQLPEGLSNTALQLRVTNARGQVVYEAAMGQEHTATLPVASWAAGLYQVELLGADKPYRATLVK